MDSCLAYSEVYEILNLLEDEYKERVPKEVIEFFEQERDKEYYPIRDVNIPLEKQNLNRKTMVVLAILNLNYWCDSEEEKQAILDNFAENEKKKQLAEKELAEKYNPDNLFKKRNKIEDTTEISIVEYKKKNFIQKLLSKIAGFFKK